GYAPRHTDAPVLAGHPQHDRAQHDEDADPDERAQRVVAEADQAFERDQYPPSDPCALLMAFPLPAPIPNAGRQIVVTRAVHDGRQLIIGLRGKVAEPGEPAHVAFGMIDASIGQAVELGMRGPGLVEIDETEL